MVGSGRQTPCISSIFHSIGPCPVTVVLAEVKLPRDLVSAVVGGDVKSERSGVMEQEAPVSITIGSSPVIEEVKMDGDMSGSDSLYRPSVV